MADYHELQSDPITNDHPGPSNIRSRTSQENVALYDPGPLETTEENWDSWHGDDVLFSRRINDGRTRCCRDCATCGNHIKKRKCLYVVFLCSFFLLCIVLVVLTVFLTGALSVRSSANQQWFESAVGYQIFSRSFQDSDGDGIGDLKGKIIFTMNGFISEQTKR